MAENNLNITRLFETLSKNIAEGEQNGITIKQPVNNELNKPEGDSSTYKPQSENINGGISEPGGGDGLSITREEFLVPEFTLEPEYKIVDDSINLLESIVEINVNVVDDIYVDIPDIRNIEYPSEVRGEDFIGYDVDFQVSYQSINTSYVKVRINGRGEKEIRSNSPNTTLTFNVKEIAINYFDLKGNENEDKLRIPIEFTPVNESGRTPVEGKTEEIIVLFDKGDLEIPRTVAINRIIEGFDIQLEENDDIFESSRYLTHLLHIGNGNNKIISNWQGVKDTNDSYLVLKLYEPLSPEIEPNDKVWISKIQSVPIIETVTISSEDDEYCPPLKGANFSLEVDNGIGFQVYDELLSSGSSTSYDLVNEYTQKLGIDTDKLEIQFTSGSVYAFENFVHFGSAEERIKNFWYKIQLLETYEATLENLTGIELEVAAITTENDFILLTETGDQLEVDTLTISPAAALEITRVTNNVNELVRGFDSFEIFLYSGTGSLSYPKTGAILKDTSDADAIDWYDNAISLSSNYDKYNVHYLNNNLPIHIVENYENEDFLLFMDMIGQHFDIIWAYIKSVTKTKKLENKLDKGITNDLVNTMLESLGWDLNFAYDSQFLWEYAFGEYKDGSPKYDRSLKSANQEVWRRLLNNLPYILKHKGTKRSLKAVLASYGIPSSILSIMEFGGPQDVATGNTTNYTFDDITAALRFDSSQYLQVEWGGTGLQYYPNSVELNLEFNEPGNYNILQNVDGSNNKWEVNAVQTTGSFGKLVLSISGSSDIKTTETSQVKLFDNEYKQIVLNRTEGALSSSFDLFIQQATADRIKYRVSSSLEIENGNSYEGGGELLVGSNLSGSIDEFRLWKHPLSQGAIDNHTLIPDAIDGNSYTASSDDLWFRLDFERPKNRHSSNGDDQILNVAISQEYGVDYATAFNFDDISTYPYNYKTYERQVTAKVPSFGIGLSNKIRFEEQTLISNLSHKTRATKKSLDQSPIDSPKLGIFLSPSKELDLSILRSFGDFNVDNYIGNPADIYRYEYKELKTLRDYYFERITRDFTEYIKLVKYIDKSLYKDLENLVPARAKVSKGLLIEPHILERSKVKWNRPESNKRNYETQITILEDDFIELDFHSYVGEYSVNNEIQNFSEYVSYEGNINQKDETQLISTYNTYTSSINYEEFTQLNGETPFYDGFISAPIGTTIESKVGLTDFSLIGFDLENGFGLFGSASHAIVTTLDAKGNLTQSRKQVYLIKEAYTESIYTQTDGYPLNTNQVFPKFGFVDTGKTRLKITQLPFGESAPTVGGDILDVTPLNGYFSTHYRNNNNLSNGLKKSFYEGSKQTTATTPDGLSPVETFTTNPNILRVADTGRGSGEPILIVD